MDTIRGFFDSKTNFSQNDSTIKYFKRTVTINGKEFFYREGPTISGGKNIALHNINGINDPNIQDLGLNEKNITIPIVFFGEGNSDKERLDSYLEQYNHINKIITNKQNIVKVVTPTGITFSCVLKDFSIKEGVKINQTECDLTFVIMPKSQKIPENILGALADPSVSKWLAFNNMLQKTRNTILTGEWKNFTKSIQKTIDMTRQTLNGIMSITGAVNTEIGRYKGFSDQISSITDDLANICTSPISMARAFIDVYNSVLDVYDTTKKNLNLIGDSYKDLGKKLEIRVKGRGPGASDGSGIPSSSSSINVTKVSSNQLIQQNNLAEDTLLVANDIACFANYAVFATLVGNFNTQDEVNEAKEKFNEMYENIIDSDLVDYDIKLNIIDIKKQMDSYFDSLNVLNVITIKIDNPDNLMNIVFNRYGDLEYYYDIMELNKDTLLDINYVYGDLKIYA